MLFVTVGFYHPEMYYPSEFSKIMFIRSYLNICVSLSRPQEHLNVPLIAKAQI